MTAEIDDARLLDESTEDLYENAPVGYLSTRPDGTVVKVNQTFLAWTGHEREDLVGRKRLHDLLAPGARIYYETHYAPLLQMQGTIREIAVELICADRSRLPVLVNSTLRRDDAGAPLFVRTTVFNATDRRRYELELLRARTDAESRARAALALAHVNDGVLLVAADGTLDVVNAAAERIFGIDAAAVGRAVEDVIPDWETVTAHVRVGEPGARVPAVTLPLSREGHEQWLSVAAVDSGDGIVYTIRDVTSERRLEQLRSEVVTVVSHELRTPLTGVFGAARTLFARYDELEDSSRRMLLQMIVEQGDRLSKIVDQILLTSRLDTGSTAVDLETFDGAKAVADVVRHLPIGDRARVVADVEEPVLVCGNPPQMAQVLTNLVDNALKYTAGTVRVAVERHDAVARFMVEDEGRGIPPGDRERIFEKFFRLDPDQRSGVGGTGLGLYIARELVTRMDGSIGVLPREAGTTFVVELPLAR